MDSLLRRVRARSEARQVALHLCRQHTDARRRQIGQYFGGIGYTAASKSWRRIEAASAKDMALRKRIEEQEKGLVKSKAKR